MTPELIAWKDGGRFTQLDLLGLNVFYKDIGDSNAAAEKTLLLIHGFPESSFSFNKVLEGLQRHFDRIVLLDLPGYGFSDKPGVEYSYSLISQADAALSIWRHVGVRGGHVLSHDMGTSVLTEIVARHVSQQLPAWFDCGLQSITFTNGSMVLELARLRLMQRVLLNKTLGPIVGPLAGYSLFAKNIRSAHGADIDESDIESLWQGCQYNDGHKKNHHLIRYLNDRRRFEKTRWLPALQVAGTSLATHICWGDADQVARVSMAHYLADNICPSAKLTIMRRAGHFCQIASPEIWLKSVLAFYSSLEN